MIVLKVTQKVGRGELTLPSIKGNLKAGAPINLTDDKFYSDDIQAALRNGFLSIEDGELLGGDNPNKTEVVNISRRPLSIDEFSFLPGESVFLTEAQIGSRNMEVALSSGMIEVKAVEIPNKKSKNKITPVKGQIRLKDRVVDSPNPDSVTETDSTETNLGAWDPFSEKIIDKEASARMLGSVVKGHVPDSEDGETQTGEVDFSEESVNAKGEPVLKRGRKSPAKKKAAKKKSSKKASKKASKTGKKKVASKKKSKSLSPVGRRRPSPTADGGEVFDPSSLPNESGGLGFVDQEQAVQRRSTHPLLKHQNNEIE